MLPSPQQTPTRHGRRHCFNQHHHYITRKRMYQPRPYNSNNGNSNKRMNNGTTAQNNTISPYPKSMLEYERFFGSLLSSSPISIRASEYDPNAHWEVMHRACSLLNVPALPAPPSFRKDATTTNKDATKKSFANRRNGNGDDADDARTHHLLQRSSPLLSNASYSSSNASSASTTSSYFIVIKCRSAS